MLLRNLNSADQSGTLGSELAEGLPTIAAFARLCGHALAAEIPATSLAPEALALVAACGAGGKFEIRGDKDGFASAERMLAVCVEITSENKLLFRDKSNPRRTMMYLDGFRQLCHSGFIMHHLLNDFSLSKTGFDLADTLDQSEYRELIQYGIEIEH